MFWNQCSLLAVNLFVMDTTYTVSVGEASRINNIDLKMRGREISFVAWKVRELWIGHWLNSRLLLAD